MTDYLLSQQGSPDLERARLKLLEELYDPLSISQLDAIGVGEGWRCLDVGAGAGSVTRMLAQRVGSTGSVLAVDLDTTLLQALASDRIEVHHHDLLYTPAPRRCVRSRTRAAPAHASTLASGSTATTRTRGAPGGLAGGHGSGLHNGGVVAQQPGLGADLVGVLRRAGGWRLGPPLRRTSVCRPPGSRARGCAGESTSDAALRADHSRPACCL